MGTGGGSLAFGIQATVSRELQAAHSPQALDRLAATWTRSRADLERSVATLSDVSGDLVHDRPRDVVLAVWDFLS